MSILIPGLSLPQKGKVKMLVLFDDGVLLDNEDGQNQWMAIELPPHGRLIDADAFFEDFADARDYEYASNEYTIIPAEGGADG